MALNLFSSTYVMVSATTTDQRTSIRSKRKAIIEHHTEVFRACLRAAGWKGPLTFACCIVHHDRFPMHCCLGSTSGAALGALHGHLMDIFTNTICPPDGLQYPDRDYQQKKIDTLALVAGLVADAMIAEDNKK